jgi:hypothetical protein
MTQVLVDACSGDIGEHLSRKKTYFYHIPSWIGRYIAWIGSRKRQRLLGESKAEGRGKEEANFFLAQKQRH